MQGSSSGLEVLAQFENGSISIIVYTTNCNLCSWHLALKVEKTIEILRQLATLEYKLLIGDYCINVKFIEFGNCIVLM